MYIENLKFDIPIYSPQAYKKLMSSIDPIEEFGGFSIKRGERFQLGPLQGSKVRQALYVVHKNLNYIKNKCNGGILTAAGLPSPQTTIVAGVAKYFGLKCAVITPKYDNNKRDFNRINASVSQKLGADVYGIRNPRPTGLEHDAKCLVKQLGYYQVKFGMCGDVAMEPVIEQVQNVPEYITDIVIISGSGLSALSVLSGLNKFPNNVKTLHVVRLSDFISDNKEKWYDDNVKCKTKLHLVDSKIPYTKEYNWNKSFEWDITYEGKAFKWMIDNFKPSKKILFWVVGKKINDLSVIEPINWHQSEHEKELYTEDTNILDKFFI
jgi:1-aminocyclopropane-1-carboxylate deaminase/D-cysteine desulfhydrase-like pyridoxal-dependent ACC family enzyme